MDIFVRHIPSGATSKQIEEWFKNPLKDCGVRIYRADKHRDKPQATITVLDATAGQRFLNNYGVPKYSPPHARGIRALTWDGKNVHCTKSFNEPSDISLEALKFEASQRAQAVPTRPGNQSSGRDKETRRFGVLRLQCGLWDYLRQARELGASQQLVFVPFFENNLQGSVVFGMQQVIVLLGPEKLKKFRVDISYLDCFDITIGSYEDPSVTFNLQFAPKVYNIEDASLLAVGLQSFNLNLDPTSVQIGKKVRLCALDPAHAKVVGSCFVYRVVLSDPQALPKIQNLLRRIHKMPTIHSTKTSTRYPPETFEESMEKLNREPSLGSKPFSLRYQVDRLARNGILPPTKVLRLIPKINKLLLSYGLESTLAALIRLIQERVLPGPAEDAHNFSIGSLEKLLEDYAARHNLHSPDNPFQLTRRHTHIQMVHKVIITPAGIYLEGPEPEPANRVLRRFHESTEHFFRVIFQDENGGSIHYDRSTNQDAIYRDRFQTILDKGVHVCGRWYSFLGFSHSSLRAQSVWFMAPLFKNQKFSFAQNVIDELGVFDHIRVPAKCAARIGQSFTETNATIDIDESQVQVIPNLVHDGYDFSDGVGTISEALLQRVWRVYGTRKLLKPTALQIRFKGYKGMVSLDHRQGGEWLRLRPNMKKFETPAGTWNLEICGAAFRPLPMILNRPLIKIFEDLGIQMQVFMNLQNLAMEKIRHMTASNINAAHFLEEGDSTRATQLPSLIRYLSHLGLNYHCDEFLYKVVEMAVVSKLRDIKYRGRIPVEKGVTLYGIMDETATLREGEVFVITRRAADGAAEIYTGPVIVTRSPTLHPGDLQRATAVQLLRNHPLRRLSNVIVFSQYGSRDLPSQLSGGDLDGDLYNVIWDPYLRPRTFYAPAEYAKKEAVQLDRPVTRKDMSDFFITFMQSDLLGMISTTHLQLADQKSTGTLDPDCIKLANMASTAVDFSKTGIPVDMRELPKYPRFRPDFMAPGPRINISEDGNLDFEEAAEEDDAFEGLDMEQQPMRFYASQKTLGHLYRAIDERKFLRNMQNEHRAHGAKSSFEEPMTIKLLKYSRYWATQFGVFYQHHKALAAQIREDFEESLATLLHTFEPSPHSPLSEAEIFCGHILGRQSGLQGKPLREQCNNMRDRFKTVVEWAITRITKGDSAIKSAGDLDDLLDEDEHYNEREVEALPRALACLEVAVTQKGHHDRRLGELKSFKYVAAGVCLRELERYRVTTWGSLSGLPEYSPQDY